MLIINLKSFLIYLYPNFGIIMPILTALYYWKITLNILFVISPFLWLTISYFKGNDDKKEKFSKITFYSVLFSTVLSAVITGVFDIYHIYELMNVKSCAELTSVTATVLTIIATVFGYFYNKSQSRIQSIHAESNWRSRLLDLEKKHFYTTDDLLELNSFINPYHKKHGKDNLDIYINNVIVDCIEHLNSQESTRESTRESNYKLEDYLKKILHIESGKMMQNEKTLWDVWPDSSWRALNASDTIKIRRCIHALLKDDWEKNVKQHTFYRE